MKKILILFICCMMLTGCNNKESIEMTRFRNEINSFCDNIKEIDASINEIANITADEDGLKEATKTLMNHMDRLNEEFTKFANMDFPTEYDYLETMADEAGSYMTEAVNAYHKTYDGNYTESMEDYAQQNYSRAYKRIQFIIDILNGKDPNTAQ